MTIDPRVINSVGEVPNWDSFGRDVRKIVLGTLEDREKKGDDPKPRLSITALPADLATRYPQLTHLHLWGIDGLRALPPLPPKLQCLDVRKCAELVDIPPLAASIDALVVEECPRILRLASPKTGLSHLREMSLRGSTKIASADLRSLIAGAPKLEILDASGCAEFTSVDAWPATLLDLRLNDCAALEAIPTWPPHLRRLELRKTPLEELENFPNALDYVDLGGMNRLTKLPEHIGKPRTLFLYGSALLMPPASEHGAAADENVAERTRAFFDDVELTGPGDVRRCKVLVLGNGSSGKTCLSLNLVGDDPHRTRRDYVPQERRLASTHGVQFHDWRNISAKLGSKMKPVHVPVWDFGGQEIYHNTHRLFLSAGTVFVVLWDPDQDGMRPERDASGYADRWRPLSYWIDYVEQACRPGRAEIAIVIPRRAERDETVRARLKQQIGEERFQRYGRCFFIDSLEQVGELNALQEELKRMVGRVVEAQGCTVPMYWEIAQDMVAEWAKRSQQDHAFAARQRQMPFRRFAELLEAAIKDRISNVDQPSCKLLKDVVRDGRFKLDDDRVRRTLSFLSRSGWVYWNRDLFEQRVIIGQKWALDGLYTILERTKNDDQSVIYLRLLHRGGRFTMDDLERWGWAHDVPDAAERELLITFMQRIGLCFALVSREASLWSKPVYLSLAHLAGRPEEWRRELNAARADLGETRQPSTRSFRHDFLHQGHWDRLLTIFGRRFGTDAEYARDGLLCRTKKRQVVMILFDLDDRGFGGSITVDVVGPESIELKDELFKAIEKSILGDIERTSTADDPAAIAGDPVGTIKVFLSYAWQPKPNNFSERDIPAGYEDPVNAIEAALKRERPKVESIRDKSAIGAGDSIMEHNDLIRKTDRVIVVHSDKYWRSPFCMHEFVTFCESFMWRNDAAQTVLTLVSHIQTDFNGPGRISRGPLKDGHALESLKKYWEQFDVVGMHPMLRRFITGEQLKTEVKRLLEKTIPELSARAELEVAWKPGSEDEALRKIKKRILGS